MTKNKVKYYNSTRPWASYASTILSAAFALFLLGLIISGGVAVYKFSNQVKESIGFKVNLLADIPEAEAEALCDTIAASEYVKSVKYMSKEQAAVMFTEELGEDFVSFIGENPLYPVIIVNLKSQQVEKKTEYIDAFAAFAAKNKYVTDVEYDKDIVGELFGIFYKAVYVMAGLILLLVFISITLISNTIRISLYSKRFALKTMLLVGAKRSFVMYPFVWRGIIYGFWGGVIAVLGLFGLMYYTGHKYPLIIDLESDRNIYIVLGAGLILLGILIAFISTYFSVRRYIKVKDHKLY